MNIPLMRTPARAGANTVPSRPFLSAVGIVLTSILAAASLPSPASAAPVPGAQAPRAQAGGATADCASLATCYTPQQIEVAYGVAPLLARGIDGRGETVVLPELAEPQFPLPTSDIRADLAEFDELFHLPSAHLRSVTTLAPSASPWLANGEEVLDTEMVHTVAPAATIVELMVSGTSLDSASSAVTASVAAIRLGSSLGGVISISAAGQTGGEHCDTKTEVATIHSALEVATARHATVVAASGDIGAVGEPCDVVEGLTGGNFPPFKEVNLPAADPLVLAAGGTSLTVDHESGAYVAENAWGLPGVGRGFQPRNSDAQLPGASPWHRRLPRRARRGRYRLSPHWYGGYHEHGRRELHGRGPRRDELQRPLVGRAHSACRPVRRAAPRLRELGHLPDRRGADVPQGVPRRHWRGQLGQLPA
jgi:subtilase family serine protease